MSATAERALDYRFFFASAAAGRLVFGVVAKHLGPARVTQLAQGGGLDLADPLAGETHPAADLFQCPRLVVDESEAQLDHAPLARAQGGKDVLHLVAEHRL